MPLHERGWGGGEEAVGQAPGQGGGTGRSGRYLKYRRNYSLSKYHLATMQRMGVPVEEFAEVDSPMSGLNKHV